MSADLDMKKPFQPSGQLLVSPYLIEMAPPGEDGWLIMECLSGLSVRLTPAESHLLARLGWTRFSLAELEMHERKAIGRLHSQGIVLDADGAFKRHQIRQLDVEINSHCNFRCVFCPVAEDPLPKKLMSTEVFAAVADRAAEYGVRLFALNHYGEPTLDPRLVERVRMAAARGIYVVLYSNGSRLSKATSQGLAASGNVQVVINFPSANPERYREATRWKRRDRVLENVRGAIEAGVKLTMAVNMPLALSAEERAASLERIAALTGVHAFESRVIGRAGSIVNGDYVTSLYHAGRLRGCLNFVEKVSVNVEGKVFLCCNDYHQRVLLGDLFDASLSEILEDPHTVRIRRWVYGADEAPADFICRSCEYTHPRNGDGPWGLGG